MVDIGDFFTFGIDQKAINKEIKNLSWQIDFKFLNATRNPYYTGKRYGSAIVFSTYYEELKQRGNGFIDLYFATVYPYSHVKKDCDKLLKELNKDLQVNIKTIKTKQNKLIKLENVVTKKEQEYFTARENLNKYYDLLDTASSELEKASNELEMYGKRNKKGDFDKRSKFYKQVLKAEKNYNSLTIKEQQRLNKIEKKKQQAYRAEQSKLKNFSKELSTETQSSTDFFHSQYVVLANNVADRIKQDILNKARIGALPMQNIPLAETTLRKRLRAGIKSKNRYYATGQLVNAIVITATIV